jgi:hypothetical protein
MLIQLEIKEEAGELYFYLSLLYFSLYCLKEKKICPLFFTDNCHAFAICEVLEIVLCIEKKLEHVLLSPWDIYSGMIIEDKQYEDGCTIEKVIAWAKSNGCILESSYPYERPFNQIVNNRKLF